jgi:hypothetical protein
VSDRLLGDHEPPTKLVTEVRMIPARAIVVHLGATSRRVAGTSSYFRNCAWRVDEACYRAGMR